jgi:geranylgeranyl diphosphate synthase type II
MPSPKTTNNFISTLHHYRETIWPVYKKYLDNFKKYPKYCETSVDYLDIKNFHHLLVDNYPERQGKYLRPSLLSLTALSLGVPMDKILLTATAMQMSEDWILIHDDIEDDSLSRRGGDTLHKIYGPNLSINAGDALHVLMWKVINDNYSHLPLDIAQKISHEFFVMLSRTVLGQTAEIKWTEENRLDLSESDILFILEGKTGYYTIAGPMRLGAILAGASDLELNKIYEFGKNLGYSFQIIDDLLDLTSDFAGLKKQIGNDIYEGKRTIMLTHLLKNASNADKIEILDILSRPRSSKSVSDVTTIIDLMKKYGSLDYSRELAKKFATKARDLFDHDLQFLKAEPFRSQLSDAIDFIINRDH